MAFAPMSGWIRQVGLIKIGTGKINTRGYHSLCTLRTFGYTLHRSFENSSFTRFLHINQIVFDKVQLLELPTTTTLNTDDEMSSSSGKERIASPVPSATSPGPGRSRRPSGIISPPARRGMKNLDRGAFDKDVKVPVVFVFEDCFNPQTVQTFKKFVMKIQGLKPISDVVEVKAEESNIESNSSEVDVSSNSGRKLKKIYLNPELVKGADLIEFVEHVIQPDPMIVSSVGYETIKFKYENWTLVQIMNSILPEDEDKISGFSQIGHIVHLNLRDPLLPYKKIIGEVILDKVVNAKTAVNKINIIESKYRNFQMELLAGDPNTVVTVKENRCEFEFDFATVYWNPRLSGEHDRLVKSMGTGEVLYDVFAGVGPFTIPAGKAKMEVLANDLNPDSFKWLEHNVKKNKVSNFVNCFNLDGRAFIQDIASVDLVKRLETEDIQTYLMNGKRFHFVMNLPAMAVDFLDSFWGLLGSLKDNSLASKISVIVHVYCFIKDVEGFKEKAVSLVKERLGYDLPSTNLVQVTFVRNVAPNKEMLRVSFLLPAEVMIGNKDKDRVLKRKFSEIDETGGGNNGNGESKQT